jgi:hypothetical protein
MIIHYFDFYIIDIILITLFNIRLVNEFKPDKLLNLITDPLVQNPASALGVITVPYNPSVNFRHDTT